MATCLQWLAQASEPHGCIDFLGKRGKGGGVGGVHKNAGCLRRKPQERPVILNTCVLISLIHSSPCLAVGSSVTSPCLFLLFCFSNSSWRVCRKEPRCQVSRTARSRTFGEPPTLPSPSSELPPPRLPHRSSPHRSPPPSLSIHRHFFLML